MYEYYLAPHGIAVDLAHVNTSIRSVNVANVERPGVKVAVQDG